VGRLDALAAKVEEAKKLQAVLECEREVLATSARTPALNPEALGKWPSMFLGEISEIQSGVTLGRNLSGHTVELPYLRVANVQEGHLDLTTIKTVAVRPEEADKWKLLPGDILLTEGGDWDKLGRGTVWRGEIDGCIHQNHIFRVRVDPTRFVPEFLSCLLGSAYGKRYFQAASKQTTNLASINQRQLKAFVVFQPPLSEQSRIVGVLKRLDSQLAGVRIAHSESAARVDALLPSLLDRAFSGAL
jgi:type I restriction enzyme S subunit